MASASGVRWPLAIWIAGSGLLLLRVALSAWRAARLLRNAAPDAGRVRFAPGIRGPVAWSFGRGAVLLPPEARTWAEETRDAVVRHESAHVARRESHALLIGELAIAVYWFHPLVWYAVHRLRIEGEHAADDAVIAGGLNPAEYATQLLAVARAGRRTPLLAGAGQPSTLTARVRAVLDPERRRSVVTRRMWCASAAAVLAIALPLAATQQGERKIYKIGVGITAPKVIRKAEPNYTQEAREAKIQGSVVLSAVLEPDGRLSTIVVEKGLDPGLDANAIEAVGTWLFKPAQKDGEPVPVHVKIEINFRLLD
jgi:TonB family protein